MNASRRETLTVFLKVVLDQASVSLDISNFLAFEQCCEIQARLSSGRQCKVEEYCQQNQNGGVENKEYNAQKEVKLITRTRNRPRIPTISMVES